jgi:ferric-dicitrate binding protein FerR (iron transport regulator)
MSHREQKLLFMAAVMVVVLIASLSRQIVDNMSFSFPSMSTSEAFQARNYSVTDGDTIRMDDGTRVRLIYRGDMTQAGCDWRITETLSMTS